MVSLTVYDGALGIGGNKIYLEENGKGVFLDFGKNFGKYGSFYEDFLKSRDTRGIHDLMYLDLLPKLNIYRPDLIPADLSVSQYPSLKVGAVLLSHAHLDHCGNIGMLRKDIPIVASPESMVIMKGIQDTTNTSIDTDITYISPRQPTDDLGLYLASVPSMNYQGKDFYSTEKPSEALSAFLSSKPGQNAPKARKKFEPGRCSFYDNAAFPFEIRAHPVDHCILGATAYILRGETTVVYTGDFRLHGKREQSTRDFISHAKDTSVLITEGTRAGPSGEREKTSEQSVSEICRERVETSSGLVIADFSARNFERLESFQEVAHKTGRELIVTAKDAYMLHSLQCVEGFCIGDSLRIYDEITDKSRRKWEQEVVQPLYSENYIRHESIRENPNNYILCFSFSDMKHLLDIKPNGGTYIYSACEAFNEEMGVDFYRLWHWLKRFEINTCGFSLEKQDGGSYELCFDEHYHASGHASGEDIIEVIDQIDPDCIVPIHTESRNWFAKNFDKVKFVVEGERYEF